MAGNKRPSFLKRQKEQARLARAAEKREARRLKKHSRGMVIEEAEPLDGLDSPDAREEATEEGSESAH
jgi:hypothetical protein